MGTEKDYDEIIAPMLLAVAERAKELGMTLVARAEWEPGEGGTTCLGDLASSMPMIMTRAASMANGNIDSMLMHLIKNYDVSASMFLYSHNKVKER